jgi:hypothetical protein
MSSLSRTTQWSCLEGPLMLQRVYLGLVLLMATPVWSQLVSTPFEMPATANTETQMLTPPPVSAEGYPTTVGSEMRSNYLSGGLIFNTAYNDNVPLGTSTTPVSDFIYTILPTIALNKTTPRQQLALTYSPGFTFYQHAGALNAANQAADLNFQYRLSEHTTIILNDSFQKSSNVFDQLYPLSGGASSGSQSPSVEVVAPYADRLNNTANVGFTYQFSRNRMIGVGGVVTESNYANPAQAPGLYNSNTLGGSVFYSQRLSNREYIGMTYQYLRSQSNPVSVQANPVSTQTQVQTHTLLPFYTIYFGPTLSISLSGGGQYFDAAQSSSPSVRSWTPSAMASIGWQRRHTNFVASYARTVTGSVGLPGAFDSNTTSASVRWQMARTWNAGIAGNYFINKNVTPSFSQSNPGGHSISGTASVQHSISEHFVAELGYSRLHQSYSDVAVISNAPDSNREYISLSYQFTRPLGR